MKTCRDVLLPTLINGLCNDRHMYEAKYYESAMHNAVLKMTNNDFILDISEGESRGCDIKW